MAKQDNVVQTVDTESCVRKPAPDVIVDVEPHRERKAILEKLDSDNPDFVHMYVASTIEDWELRSKRMEFVYVKGGIVHHKGDPVVRIPRSVWDKQRIAESRRSEEQMRQLVSNENLTSVRNPKKPTSGNKEEK